MKKTMLWSALFTLICTQVQAEVTQQPQSQTPGSTTAPVTNKVNQDAVVEKTNPNANQGTLQTVPQTQVQPTNQPSGQNVNNTQPNQQIQQTPNGQPQTQIQVQPQPAPIINCNYKIPAQTKTIEQSLVLTWSEKAATQAFDFDPASLDGQIQKLKNCFTDQGWSGFSSALEKSGNLEAIKAQKLTVSSLIDGEAQVTEAKDNQWKITLPLQVVYQNDKEKVTQLLSLNLTVGRKITGDLGIIQMIATPRTLQANNTTTPNATGTSATPPSEQKPSADTTNKTVTTPH